MIALPRNPDEWRALASFLHFHAHVQPSADLQCVGWVSDEDKKLVIVVGLNGFIGKVAQIHIAMAEGWHFIPRTLIAEVFKYAFVTAKREQLVGIVNSKNERAMRLDLHLGFRELLRLPGMHDDDGDIVLLGMKKSECRYVEQKTEEVAA